MIFWGEAERCGFSRLFGEEMWGGGSQMKGGSWPQFLGSLHRFLPLPWRTLRDQPPGGGLFRTRPQKWWASAHAQFYLRVQQAGNEYTHAAPFVRAAGARACC